jgi:DNA (cytosine-5)-methyltransferase 1
MSRWLGQQIVRPGSYDSSGDLPLTDEKWPAAAWSLGDGKVYVSTAGDWPRSNPSESLEAFLLYKPKPLSARATTGFLRRAARGSLRFPEGFIEEVEEHALAQGADPLVIKAAA